MAILGVIVQTLHTFFLSNLITPYNNIIIVIFESILLGLFISGCLLIFTVKAATNDKIRRRKYLEIANWFASLEIFINLTYWLGAVIVVPIYVNNNTWSIYIIYKTIGGIILSIAVPLIIKQFAGEIEDIDESSIEQKEITELKNRLYKLENVNEYTMEILDYDEESKTYPKVILKANE